MLTISLKPQQRQNQQKTIQQPIWVQFLVVLLLLCLEFLLLRNMSGSGWNETDVLPLAKQFVDPNWIPGDWYLNQPPTYRVLFQTLCGWMITTWGFLATSIVGRFLCYCLVAIGVVLLGRSLGLTTLFMLLAVNLFVRGGCGELFNSCAFRQGAIAGEWWLGGLEAKACAYSLLLLALWCLLTSRFIWAAVALGIMTSFHVLVGGWAFLTVATWLLLTRKTALKPVWYWALLLLLYGVGSVFALPPLLNQILTPAPATPITPSFLYVFVRLPHHLNPLTWDMDKWQRPMLLLLLFAGSLFLLWRRQKIDRQAGLAASETNRVALGLAQLTGIALIPFVLGLMLAPFDQQGQFLQYYPFRLGDVLLPISTAFLLSQGLQQGFKAKVQKTIVFICILLLSVILVAKATIFAEQVASLSQFPGKVQEVDAEQRDFYAWIRNHTPTDARIISPPVEMISFSWLTERATIAKVRLLPQTKAGLIAWYDRLTDLAGGDPAWARVERTADNRLRMESRLTKAYKKLSTVQVLALMRKYEADYFVTRKKHRLELPIAYANSDYLLYRKPDHS